VTKDEDKRMPLGGRPLPEETLALVRTWIDSGANWPETAVASARKPEPHWAFQRLGKFQPPSVKNSPWARTGVDRFILAQLEAKGLTPAPEATRAQLIRRVAFDLTGLPPEIGPGCSAGRRRHVRRPSAGQSTVRRALGRHWLDVARYADSEGYHEDAIGPRCTATAIGSFEP
jgi:hypothetical protein